MNWIEDILGLLFVLGIVALPIWYYNRKVKRRARDTFSELLAKDLTRHGCQLVSSSIPQPFVTGPFPQGISEVHGRCNFTFTSSWQYREVALQDAAGQEHVAWARLFFASGEPEPQIDWNPELDTLERRQNKVLDATSQ